MDRAEVDEIIQEIRQGMGVLGDVVHSGLSVVIEQQDSIRGLDARLDSFRAAMLSEFQETRALLAQANGLSHEALSIGAIEPPRRISDVARSEAVAEWQSRFIDKDHV